MPDSDITVSDLTGDPGIGHIFLQWSYDDPHANGGLPFLALDAVEVHAASTNNRALATKVAEGVKFAAHFAINPGTAWFYWIKARNRSGLYGDWYPSSATGGLQKVVGLMPNITVSQTGGVAAHISQSGSQVTLALTSPSLGVDLPTLEILGGATGGGGNPTVEIVNSQSGEAIHCYTNVGSGPCFVATQGDSGPGCQASSSSGFAFYSTSGGYGPFTGQHDALLLKDSTAEIGDIVCDRSILIRKGVSDTLAEVEISREARQRIAIGVLAVRRAFEDFDPAATFDEAPEHVRETFDRAIVNALGEGQINVCGENGPIEAGDLIVTSSVPGKGMRQDDDVLRSYTVARAREGADLKSADDHAMIACIYLCG